VSSHEANGSAASVESVAGSHVSRGTGLVLVSLAAVLWSLGGVGVKVLSMSAMSIAGYRSTFAAIAMVLVLSARRTVSLREVKESLARPLVWVAALSYALMVVCFCVAVKKTTAANAIFIQYTAPIYVALLSRPILGERVHARDFIATFASIVGMALFFRGELSTDGQLGNIVAVLSSFGFAGLPLAIRREERALAARGEIRKERPVIAMILGNVIAACVCAPFMAQETHASTSGLMVVAALGTFQIALPYLLYGVAVRALSALESSLVAMIEPVLNPLWVLLATAERPSRNAVIGGVIILFAVIFRSVSRASIRQQIT
jgi:DME family drug/metabolite transporter